MNPPQTHGLCPETKLTGVHQNAKIAYHKNAPIVKGFFLLFLDFAKFGDYATKMRHTSSSMVAITARVAAHSPYTSSREGRDVVGQAGRGEG